MKLETARKKQLLLGAGLLCLLFVVISFLDFDAESLKERLIAEVWAQKARTLEINGGLRLKILPRLAIEIRDAKLSGPNGEGEFFRVGQLRGALEILPLLVGKITVNRFEAYDFFLAARRYPDGSTNFDDLLAGNEDKNQEPLDFEIGKVVLLNGHLSWLDATSEQLLLLEEVYLRSGALGEKAQGQLEMGGKAVLSPSRIIPFTLDSRYRINGGAHSLQLDMPRLNLKMSGAEKLRLELTAQQIIANWNLPSLSIAALKLEGEHEEKDEENLSAVLKLEKLDWHQGNGEARGGTFQFLWAQDRVTGQGKPLFSLNAKLPMLESKEKNWQGNALTGVFQGNLQGLTLEGQIDLPMVIRAREGGSSLEMDNLAIAAKASGGQLKESLDLQLQGNLAISLANGASSGNWRLSQADSRLDLAWRLTLPPGLAFQANLNHLDVDRYWNQEETKTSPKKAADEQKEGDATSSPFPGGLNGVLNIGALKIGGVQLEKLEGRVTWANGQMEVSMRPTAEPSEKQVRKAPRKNTRSQ